MTAGIVAKWPVLGRHERAAEWLRIWADLGRAPRTIDAYARGLAEYLQVCERDGVDPVAATRAQVAAFVRELTSRPSRRGPNVLALGLSGDGAGMMGVAFKDEGPALILADLTTKTGRDIQAGYRFLFMGSQQAIRNPAAHEPFGPMDDDDAFELLSLASHLMRKLDLASRSK